MTVKHKFTNIFYRPSLETWLKEYVLIDADEDYEIIFKSTPLYAIYWRSTRELIMYEECNQTKAVISRDEKLYKIEELEYDEIVRRYKEANQKNEASPPIEIQITEPFTLENIKDFPLLELSEHPEIIIARPKREFENFEKLFDYLFEKRIIEIEDYSTANEDKQFALKEDARYKNREAFQHWYKYIFKGIKDSQFSEESFNKYLEFVKQRKEKYKTRIKKAGKIIKWTGIVIGALVGILKLIEYIQLLLIYKQAAE